jgi:hypothetical protein
MDAVFGLKVPRRARSDDHRNFKSTALVGRGAIEGAAAASCVAAGFVHNRARARSAAITLQPLLLEGNLARKRNRKSGKNKQMQQLRASNKT